VGLSAIVAPWTTRVGEIERTVHSGVGVPAGSATGVVASILPGDASGGCMVPVPPESGGSARLQATKATAINGPAKCQIQLRLMVTSRCERLRRSISQHPPVTLLHHVNIPLSLRRCKAPRSSLCTFELHSRAAARPDRLHWSPVDLTACRTNVPCSSLSFAICNLSFSRCML
jgi:hypothetical protein